MVGLVALLWGSSADAFHFAGVLQGGIRYRYDTKSPNLLGFSARLDREFSGVEFLFGAAALFLFHPQLMLTVAVDVGELHMGRGNIGDNAPETWVLLNNIKRNLTAMERSDLHSGTQQCLHQAQVQGLQASRCQTPHWLLFESLFLRELVLTVHLDPKRWFKLDVGMFSKSLAQGLLYENYALGLQLRVDRFRVTPRRLPLRFEAAFFLTDSSFTAEGKLSPTLHTALSYQFSKRHGIQLFFTFLHDGNDLAAKVLLPLWQEARSQREVNTPLYQRTGQHTNFSCFSPTPTRDLDLFRLVYQAQGDAVNRLLNYEKLCSQLPRSQGNHFWLGASGSGAWKKLHLSGIAILYFSQFQMGFPRTLERAMTTSGARTRDDLLDDLTVHGLGFLGKGTLRIQWTHAFSTTLFFLFATGDSFQEGSSFHAFLSIAQQVRETRVFFNGGLNAFSSRRGLHVSGLNGKGYLTPGVHLRYFIENKTELKLTAALLWSHIAPTTVDAYPAANNFYGFELNLLASYYILKWLQPLAEFNVFVPGPFFASTNPPPLHFSMRVGFDFLF